MDFTGKRVLVTGGTRGIGRATVAAFVAAGAQVAVNGRTEQSTAAALSELSSTRAVGVAGDIGLADDCRRVVQRAVAAMGGLDVLVNNAGIGGAGEPIEKITVEQWDRTMNVNLRGTFLCIQAAVASLRQSKGNIVNIASVSGLRGHGNGVSDYYASKGGVINLTRDLAIELGPDIRVNCVCPGATDTDMLREGESDVAAKYGIVAERGSLGRVARPEEMASAILYLASDMASFVTGSAHVADAGISIRI
jgi:NAD(P)-dependent dehydrogenase (short-subunit alcohol dehydrogenase family)